MALLGGCRTLLGGFYDVARMLLVTAQWMLCDCYGVAGGC